MHGTIALQMGAATTDIFSQLIMAVQYNETEQVR